MNNKRRIQKVSSLLKKEISLILINDLNDNLIIDNFVSITKIELSGDLQHSKVFISTSAEEKIKELIIENLNSAKNKIRFLLSQRIMMRRIPDLVFKIDRVLDQELAVLKVLDKLREKSDERNED
tara:strand:- start:1055 stop:1429 length:375 start_codon:yes stop_codon:yes gene_type:complete